ncbi:MAG: DUF2225 domain-containing protein [Treponema sp.]|jgi:uncharacterized protein (DUF2225 family)|nr:DUF2225 domain-containing protein [Treponema sp.]
MKTEARETKISFQSKEEYTCPVCNTAFHREELLSGSGRLIAGMLTDELHRLYEPSAKYGEVYPLAYVATVCPECWFASVDKDFAALPPNVKERVFNSRDKRIADARLVFPNVDFHEPREMVSGAASQYLAMRCYDYYSPEFSPTIKQGIAALRAGWLLDEMDKRMTGQHYDWLAVLFKKKALYFYSEAIRREQKGVETLSGLKIFGPDTDKNYAYEGALYLSALLQYKYGFTNDPQLRVPALGEAKRTIARIFGIGKSSKSKPGPLLEHARDLYDKIGKELHETDE